ncbi:MAG: phosphoesterase PA-phosphatase [Piscirickettsiaceae bacterium]|nr:MAG: phosphoesterase PA-phosphatase [Piscirickettsiaceae bacterium]PCI70232.1 MAG: phosphoesterase PA-phosphatase [Piscirickettsiaceae bacterium]
MFADLLNSITDLINQYPTWAGAIVFLVAMLESLAIIGVVVPGVAIMFAIGALISNGTLELVSTILWAAAGASFGDGLSFALGKYYDEKIYQIAWFKKHPNVLKKGHAFFDKYGVISILIGRFVGPIRAVIPLIAGILDMPLKHYIPINIIASLLWAPAYLFPGLIVGGSISNIPTDWLDYWPVGLTIIISLLLVKQLKKKKNNSR